MDAFHDGGLPTQEIVQPWQNPQFADKIDSCGPAARALKDGDANAKQLDLQLGLKMAKLIMWNLMSLDGFFEGPGHDLSWHHDYWSDDLERLAIEQGTSASALLFGRITYELMANHWPSASGEVADFMNALPKYVFSRTLTQSDWNNTQMFGGDAANTIERLKREATKDIFIFGSSDLASQLTEHGLIDEYRIGVAPLLLGQGTPLFKTDKSKIKLQLLDTKPIANGVVILRYMPAR